MDFEQINPDDMPPFLKTLFGMPQEPSDPTKNFVRTKQHIADVSDLWVDDTPESIIARAFLRSFSLLCDEGLHPEKFEEGLQINLEMYEALGPVLESSGRMLSALDRLGRFRMEAVEAAQRLSEGSEAPPSA